MFKALRQRFRLSRLTAEYVRQARSVDGPNVSTADRQQYLTDNQEWYLAAKAKIFNDDRTIGNQIFWLGYNLRYKWWVRKERKFTQWILRKTPYIKVGRTLRGMPEAEGRRPRYQAIVDAFYERYDYVVASTTEARKRHLQE